MVQTLSQIKTLLAERGLRPRRTWGQNFLHDHHKLTDILRAADVRPNSTVLEVGPGTGVLTEALLEAGARLIAVEIDPELCAILRNRIGPDRPDWTLLNIDVLDTKHALNPAIDRALSGRDHPFMLIANLPYQIASPLLVNLAMDYPGMSRAVVMIQREVADRITASPGSKTYGPLTVMLQAAFHVAFVSELSPNCFWPRPKIESAVIRLDRRSTPLADDLRALARLLHTLFSKRRKQIGAILGRHIPLPESATHTMRPEQLTVEQLIWVAEHQPPTDAPASD